MKASELRIGNWLQYLSGDSFQVSSTDFKNIEDIPEHLRPKPIPLTEEWLLKLGFKEDDDDSDNPFCTLRLGNFLFQSDLSVNYERVYLRLNNTDLVFHYVHQLQNLYFDISDKELTVAE